MVLRQIINADGTQKVCSSCRGKVFRHSTRSVKSNFNADKTEYDLHQFYVNTCVRCRLMERQTIFNTRAKVVRL